MHKAVLVKPQPDGAREHTWRGTVEAKGLKIEQGRSDARALPSKMQPLERCVDRDPARELDRQVRKLLAEGWEVVERQDDPQSSPTMGLLSVAWELVKPLQPAHVEAIAAIAQRLPGVEVLDEADAVSVRAGPRTMLMSRRSAITGSDVPIGSLLAPIALFLATLGIAAVAVTDRAKQTHEVTDLEQLLRQRRAEIPPTWFAAFESCGLLPRTSPLAATLSRRTGFVRLGTQ